MPASIIFNQVSKSAGSAGIAREDFDTGLLVTCSNATGETAYVWTLVDVPIRSVLVRGTIGVASTFTFTPDVKGTYLISLQVNASPSASDNATSFCAVVTFATKTLGWRYPAAGEADQQDNQLKTGLGFPSDINVRGWATERDLQQEQAELAAFDVQNAVTTFPGTGLDRLVRLNSVTGKFDPTIIPMGAYTTPITGVDGTTAAPTYSYASQTDTGNYLKDTINPTWGVAVEGGDALLVKRVLDIATGNEIAFAITPTINKATSGNYTALEIDVTETAAPGSTNKLFDLKKGGASQWSVDSFGDVVGTTWHRRARVATTTNGALATAFASGQVVDDVTLATNNYLVIKNQSTGSENGFYRVNAVGAPTRVGSMAVGASAAASVIRVSEGTTNNDTGWVCTNNVGADVVGTDALVFASTASSGGAGDVVGPASATDNAFPRFDGTTGKLLQAGQTVEDDGGNLFVIGDIVISGTVDGVDVGTLDANAFRADRAGEIAALAVKATPVGVDHVLGENSEAGNVKIRIPVSALAGGVTDHGALTGLVDDDHAQYLLVDGTRAMTGGLDMGAQPISSAGTVNGVTVTALAGRLERAAADELDGDHLGIDYTPSNYTPSTTPAEAAHVDDLAAHLAGINDRVAQATTGGRGTIELATAAEVDTGTDLTRVAPVLEMKRLAQDDVWVGNVSNIATPISRFGFDTTALHDNDFAGTYTADLVRTAASTYASIRSNLAAAVSPTATDDATAGYSVGSQWINTADDSVWRCVDSTASNAIWRCVSGSRVRPEAGALYTVAATDDHACIAITSASLVIVTIPAGLPTGLDVEIWRAGLGSVTIQGSGGLTLSKPTVFNEQVKAQHGSVVVTITSATTALMRGYLGP